MEYEDTGEPAVAEGDILEAAAGDSDDDYDGLEKNDNMTETEEKDKKSSTRRTSESTKKLALAANKEPTFFIGGGNGVNLINEIMENMGWRRTMDKYDDRFKLKWVELKSTINYGAFREGDQLVNHIPNCNLLTNKLGLLNSLQDYDKTQTALRRGRGPRVKLDFIPETYRLDDPRDRETFFETHQPGDIWICKPTGRNQGKGIYLVRDAEEIRKLTEVEEANRGRPCKPLNRIIQRYITNPLLLDNKKFDIRCYMLVASTVPFLVLYHRGYVRTSIHDYDNDCDNLIAHLTNQYIQKKDPSYKDVKEDTAWSMERFNDYLNQNVLPDLGVEPDWALNALEDKIQQIMTYTFNAVKHKLNAKLGYFDLYGFDFMVDTNLKVYLIEVNVNPCLATNCEALKDCITAVVTETIHVALECFEKSKRGKPLLPLQSANTFKVIHNGSAGRGGGPAKPRRTSSISPIRSVQHSATAKTRTPKRPASDSPGRQANSLSPVKETKEVPPEAAVGTKIGTKTEKGKKSSAKGATPKATSISATKANSSNKHSAKTKAAAPPASTVSPYNSKIHIPQDNVKLKMSHNEIAGKQTKERKSPHQTEEDKEVPNRGS